MQKSRAYFLLLIFLVCIGFAYADKKKGRAAQKDERVYLDHSDELYYDMYGPNPTAQIVKGHVRFTHKGGHLTCDSAYFYQEQNSVRAMGHVKYVQGDTLSMTCERGFYDGQMEMMEARANVVLRHRKRFLYTDSLNFDRVWDNAYFFDGGKLVEDKDQLVSDWGNYNTKTKKAVFYYDVVMLSGDRRVETDTLHYDSNTREAHVVGPSVITQDSTVINTVDGYFSSTSNQSRLYSRSEVVDGEKTIIGDSLLYNKESGQAEGYGNVIFTDHKNKNSFIGDRISYNEQTGCGYATINALVKDYSQGPDTLYMHADSIKLYTFNIKTDSVYRKVHCFDHVKIYRTDVQAICDSLVANSLDSCLTMYKDPIAWEGARQVLGEKILVYSCDSTIRDAHVIGQALSIEKCDEEDHYNQIASKEMHSYFTDGKIRKVTAYGNVRLVYYPIDEEDSTLMLMNYTETDTLHIFISPERQIEKVRTTKHVSDMYPMNQIPTDKIKLDSFAWFEDLRPKDKDDVFNWRGKPEGQKLIIEAEAPRKRNVIPTALNNNE